MKISVSGRECRSRERERGAGGGRDEFTKVTDQILFVCNLSYGKSFSLAAQPNPTISFVFIISFSFRQNALPANIFRYTYFMEGHMPSHSRMNVRFMPFRLSLFACFCFVPNGHAVSWVLDPKWRKRARAHAPHNFDILNPILIFTKISRDIIWYLCMCDKQIRVDLNLWIHDWNLCGEKKKCGIGLVRAVLILCWIFSERARIRCMRATLSSARHVASVCVCVCVVVKSHHAIA